MQWITSYNLTIPQIDGRSHLWHFQASLGFQFLSGGSLSLLLRSASNNTPDARCYINSGDCYLGANVRMNENVLQELLQPGDYELWILDQTGEKVQATSLLFP